MREYMNLVENAGGEYFHVTPTSNLASIMDAGLIPQSGDRSQQMGDHGVYLFKSHVDAEDAVTNWLGDEFEDEPLSLLRVRLPIDARITQEAFEVVCHDVIPAANIEIVGEI